MTTPKPRKQPRRVVLGVGQPLYDPKDKRLELIVADFIRPARVLKLKFGGLGPWNKIRLVAEVLK